MYSRDKMQRPSRQVDTHADPENVQELIHGIPDTPAELLSYAQRVLPNWIIKKSPQFSIDLFKFNEQWAFACVQLNITPQTVLLVKEAYLDLQGTTHTLVREVCRKLSTRGFVVMDMINFDSCQRCSEVIVSKEKVMSHGKEWTGYCQRCVRHPL